VRSRFALGERGPTANTLLQIEGELSGATDIDLFLTNDSSIEHFYLQIDALIQALQWGSDHYASNATILRRFHELAADELSFAKREPRSISDTIHAAERDDQ
jgi:hypothetical protein